MLSIVLSSWIHPNRLTLSSPISYLSATHHSQQTTIQNNVLTTECIICGFDLELETDVEVNELIECIDCGTELEIDSLSPLVLIEAPCEGEDWGQ